MMNPSSSNRFPGRNLVIVALVLVGVLLMGACSPIVEADMRSWDATRTASLATPEPLAVTFVTPEPTGDAAAEATSEAPAEATESPAEAIESPSEAQSDMESAPTATIGVPILRVRVAPSTNAEVIGVVYADQVYPVIGRSSNGLWMQLGELPGLPQESGWVISELALVIGDFSEIPVVQVPDEAAVAPSRQTEEGSGQTPGLVLPTPTPQPIATVPATPLAPASGATPIGETTNGGEGTNGGDATNGAPADDNGAVPAPIDGTPAAPADEGAAGAPVVEPPLPLVPAQGGVPLPEGVEPPPAGFALVVTDGVRLRVRDLPNTDSVIVGYAYPGESFRILQQSDDGAWTQINGSPESRQNPSGGWVASEFLFFGQ